MFEGLRWRLLIYYLSVMAAILGAFGLGVYGLFSRSLYQQLDQKLMTLAQAATPSMKEVTTEGEAYLENLEEVPWRDIFNRNQQSLEWFDTEGRRLALRGKIDSSLPPQVGMQMTSADPPIRAFTVSVFKDSPNADTPELRGFIRASQNTQEIRTSQQQLLTGLALGGSGALLLVGLGGFWLTQISLQPIEKKLSAADAVYGGCFPRIAGSSNRHQDLGGSYAATSRTGASPRCEKAGRDRQCYHRTQHIGRRFTAPRPDGC